MDFARRIAEYDLMRAYAWWRGLPGLVRGMVVQQEGQTLSAFACTDAPHG
ncbi:hypothetical protein dsat_1784 [Alkalidesulfovibrio alkalitolerans DSM 16529]|jgi:hypothetical protein|uniref:Uncharacterized protein n=1 Tax=Alkalidesulfovibrio alkalitolerans DSM 16529 TaxID=1121439 RepID=S7THH7_9BACT|nr:hypothetical protein [Alkalidesulfovibrio alkalitolerans]EPR36256.1 hypothetical protein dsat_1784 [Alkalidesulfovibrio alkalitolerans DSM 16529]